MTKETITYTDLYRCQSEWGAYYGVLRELY